MISVSILRTTTSHGYGAQTRPSRVELGRGFKLSLPRKHGLISVKDRTRTTQSLTTYPPASYRSASIGSIEAALRAGYNAEKIAMTPSSRQATNPDCHVATSP